MTNIISNIYAIVASTLINIHASTNLQSLVKEDMNVFWTMHFQECDASKYQHVINSQFIDPWVFDLPNINLNRVPRATINTLIDRHPEKYPDQ